jgi:hypothetical protein
MAGCPSCQKPIPFHTIAFAAFPMWLTCPRCRARLVGGPFVVAQTAVVLLAAAAVTAWACAALMGPPTLVTGAKAVGLALLVVIPFAAGNVAVTMLWGHYHKR